MTSDDTRSSGPTVYVGVSTKAYLGHADTLSWLDGIRAEVNARPGLADAGIQTFVIPSSPLILAAVDALAATGCWIGAQDAHWEAGAATGGVSIALLAELGVTIVELGHSERRRIFHETPEDVARKLASTVQSGLVPLLCVGEELHRDTDGAIAECVGQVRSAVSNDPEALAATIIAYEPQWAIGSSAPASADYVNRVISGMRAALSGSTGEHPRAVIYGGSAGPGTLPPLVSADGLFLGRFAHDPANFGLVLDEALARNGARG